MIKLFWFFHHSLTAVPPHMVELVNLESLNLFNNHIEELPTNISSMQNLKLLNVGYVLNTGTITLSPGSERDLYTFKIFFKIYPIFFIFCFPIIQTNFCVLEGLAWFSIHLWIFDEMLYPMDLRWYIHVWWHKPYPGLPSMFIIIFSGVYLGLKCAKYLCRMHNKMFKRSFCVPYKLQVLEVFGSKNQVNHNSFQQYALFERRTKLLYMILPLADARWLHTTHYPGVLRGVSYLKSDSAWNCTKQMYRGRFKK